MKKYLVQDCQILSDLLIKGAIDELENVKS